MLPRVTTCREEAGEGSEVRRESGVRLLARGVEEEEVLVKDISGTSTQVRRVPAGTRLLLGYGVMQTSETQNHPVCPLQAGCGSAQAPPPPVKAVQTDVLVAAAGRRV